MAPGPMDRAGRRSSRRLAADGVKAIAAPLPLTSFSRRCRGARSDARARRRAGRPGRPRLCRRRDRARPRSEKVKALVYVCALAPDEGETVADVFCRGKPHPQAPKLAPDATWVDLSARGGLRRRLRAKRLQGRAGGARGGPAAALARLHHRRRAAASVEGPADLVPGCRAGPHDRLRKTSASWPSA